jgi:hypothetical protein
MTEISNKGRVGRRPADAAGFVASVELGTNNYLTDVIYDIFAANARSVSITDGGRDENIGVDAIHHAWVIDCATFRTHDFNAEKHLIAATEDTIVNTWRGGFNGNRDGCGIEVWRFDHDAKVIEQQLYSYLRVRPTTSALQGLKLLLTSPRVALAAGWARFRAR